MYDANRKIISGWCDMSGIFLGIIIGTIVVLLVFLLILFLRQHQTMRMKNDGFSLESLASMPILNKIINVLMPAAEEREYKKMERLISDAGVNLSMKVLYLLKFVVPIIIFIVLVSVFLMNRSVMIDAIITGQMNESVNIIGSSKKNNTLTNAEKRDRERANKDTYAIVDKLFKSKISNAQKDMVMIKKAVEEVLIENNMASKNNAPNVVEREIERYYKVKEAEKINPMAIVIILLLSLVGYYFPNVYLIISRMIRHQSFDNEIISLEMLTIMVGSIESVTVKEILRILSLNSKAYKANFEKALLEYPIDFEQALINLGSSSKNKDFQALVSTLRQCATSDKYSALQTLQRRRISRKEYRKLIEEKKVETKMYIAFVMMIPILFFIVKLLLSPWQDLLNTSGIL